jgi:hypothetical protein
MFQNSPLAGPMTACFRSLMFQNSHVDDIMGQNRLLIATFASRPNVSHYSMIFSTDGAH